MPHSFDHTLLIRVNNDECIVAQSVYGYYGLGAWDRFDEPLRIDEAYANPVLGADWHHELIEQPRFRGVLTLDSGNQLAASIDLVCKGSKDAFRDLTGVYARGDLPRLQAHVMRLNLTTI